MAYQLFYWAFRGRGEQIRLLLSELGQDFADIHIDIDGEFVAMRNDGPSRLYFGSVPMLEDGGFRLSQGPAIMNYLGHKHGIMPSDPQAAAKTEAMVLGAEDMRMAYFRTLGARAEEKQAKFVAGDWKGRWLRAWEGLLKQNGDTGYLVGTSLTQADVAVWDAIDAIVTSIEDADLRQSTRVEKFFQSIRARPNVAKYLSSDRRLDAPRQKGA